MPRLSAARSERPIEGTAPSRPEDRAYARGVDAMVRNSVKILAASLIVCGTFGVPAVSAAQESVAVECGPGQRAVMEQRRVNGRTQVVARCEGTQRRATVQTRQTANGTYRPAAQRGS